LSESVRQPPTALLYLRSLLFWLGFFSLTLVFALLLFISFPLPFDKRFYVTRGWSKATIAWLGFTCRLSYEVSGTENIGAQPGIVFSKHQSTWETLSLNFWFTPQSWVVKRELLWIPLFGWGMSMMEAIAIDRSAGRKAVDQLVEQGRDRLEKSRWIILFPEGTRIAPGKRGRYRIGGALLAQRTGYPVTPVAHNAGEYWPRRQFIKKPGIIQVHIGPPIDSHGKTAQQILVEAENWIETEMASITTLAHHEHGPVANT
jgi:1-acyl-sn-glycerol-3-phosphate acyltransferase